MPAACMMATLLLRGRLNLVGYAARTNLIIIESYVILIMREVLVLRTQLVYLCLQLQLVLLLGRDLLSLVRAIIHFQEVDCRRLCLLDGADWLLAAASDSLHCDGLPSLVMGCAMSDCLVGDVHPLPLLRLLRHFLLLHPGGPLSSVETSDHVGCSTVSLVEEILVRSKRLLGEQVIRCRDLVVSVGLDALHGVVRIVVKLVKHHLIQLVIHGHWLLSRKQSLRPLVLHLLEPDVTPYFINTVTFLRISIQNFC